MAPKNKAQAPSSLHNENRALGTKSTNIFPLWEESEAKEEVETLHSKPGLHPAVSQERSDLNRIADIHSFSAELSAPNITP